MSRHITCIIIIIIIIITTTVVVIIIIIIVVIIIVVKCSQIRLIVLLQFKTECPNCKTYSQFLVKCCRCGINEGQEMLTQFTNETRIVFGGTYPQEKLCCCQCISLPSVLHISVIKHTRATLTC
jgi:hypothetical protein